MRRVPMKLIFFYTKGPIYFWSLLYIETQTHNDFMEPLAESSEWINRFNSIILSRASSISSQLKDKGRFLCVSHQFETITFRWFHRFPCNITWYCFYRCTDLPDIGGSAPKLNKKNTLSRRIRFILIHCLV